MILPVLLLSLLDSSPNLESSFQSPPKGGDFFVPVQKDKKSVPKPLKDVLLELKSSLGFSDLFLILWIAGALEVARIMSHSYKQ